MSAPSTRASTSAASRCATRCSPRRAPSATAPSSRRSSICTRIGGFVAKSLTLEPRAGTRRRGSPRRRRACSTRSASRTSASTRSCARSCRRCPSGVVVVASVFETEIERYAEVAQAADRRAARRGARGERLLPAREERRDRVRPAARAARAARARGARARPILPLLVKLSPNVTDIAEMARVCEGEGADGDLADQLRAGARGRRRDAPPGALERARRALRPGDPADRAAHGLAGEPRGEDPDLRDGRDHERRGRGEVPAVRRHRGPGRHRELPEPGIAGEIADGLVAYAERHGIARARRPDGGAGASALRRPASAARRRSANARGCRAMRCTGERKIVRHEVFVGRYRDGALPAPVVVAVQRAADFPTRIQVLELAVRRLVPVGVRASHCDLVAADHAWDPALPLAPR